MASELLRRSFDARHVFMHVGLDILMHGQTYVDACWFGHVCCMTHVCTCLAISITCLMHVLLDAWHMHPATHGCMHAFAMTMLMSCAFGQMAHSKFKGHVFDQNHLVCIYKKVVLFANTHQIQVLVLLCILCKCDECFAITVHVQTLVQETRHTDRSFLCCRLNMLNLYCVFVVESSRLTCFGHIASNDESTALGVLEGRPGPPYHEDASAVCPMASKTIASPALNSREMYCNMWPSTRMARSAKAASSREIKRVIGDDDHQ